MFSEVYASHSVHREVVMSLPVWLPDWGVGVSRECVCRGGGCVGGACVCVCVWGGLCAWVVVHP